MISDHSDTHIFARGSGVEVGSRAKFKVRGMHAHMIWSYRIKRPASNPRIGARYTGARGATEGRVC